jgi:hypothetical protein
MRTGSLEGAGNPFRSFSSLEGVGSPFKNFPSLEGMENSFRGGPSLKNAGNPFKDFPSLEGIENPFKSPIEVRQFRRLESPRRPIVEDVARIASIVLVPLPFWMPAKESVSFLSPLNRV